MPENSETRYIMKMRQVNGTFMVRKCFGQNFWGYIESIKINPKRLNWVEFTPELLDEAINNIQLNDVMEV